MTVKEIYMSTEIISVTKSWLNIGISSGGLCYIPYNFAKYPISRLIRRYKWQPAPCRQQHILSDLTAYLHCNSTRTVNMQGHFGEGEEGIFSRNVSFKAGKTALSKYV